MSDKGEGFSHSENSENKNLVYYQRYCNEPDSNKRLELTKDFIEKDAGDLWLYLYSTLNQEVKKNTTEREAVVEKISAVVDEERKSGEENLYVSNLVKYAELTFNQFEFKKALEDGQLPIEGDLKRLFLEEMEKSSQEAWKGFVDSLDTDVDPELSGWLKSMINEQKTIIYKENGNKNILQAPMAYSKTDQLIICPDLIPSRFTGSGFLLSLAHERGHYLTNHSNIELKKMGEGALVFEEFFAMMEEQREYSLASDKFRGAIRKKDVYELSADSNQTIIGNKLPNSDIVPNFKPGKISRVLFDAYNHALIQLTQSQKMRLVQSMIDDGKDMNDIRTELGKFDAPVEPLLKHSDMNWRKIDDN